MSFNHINSRVAFLPVEIFGREIESKQLLTLDFLKLGYKVIVGHKWHVNNLASQMAGDGDVYWSKGLPDVASEKFFMNLKRQRVKIWGSAEEPLFDVVNFEDKAEKVAYFERVCNFDKWFTWGPRDWNYLMQKSSGESKFLHSGTPRATFWQEASSNLKYLENMKNRHRELGEYVIIATSFTIQSSASFSALSNLKREYFKNQNLFESYELGISEQIEQRELQVWIQVIERILATSNYRIVIRPHPAERVNGPSRLLERHFKTSKRVLVNRSIYLSGLLQASSGVFHISSTLGLEALIYGVRTFSVSKLLGSREMNGMGRLQNIGRKIESVKEIDFSLIESGQTSKQESSQNLSELIWQDSRVRMLPSINPQGRNFNESEPGKERGIHAKLVDFEVARSFIKVQILQKFSKVNGVRVMDATKRPPISKKSFIQNLTSVKVLHPAFGNEMINVHQIKPSTFLIGTP